MVAEMNKSSSQQSQVVWPKAIWHSISVDKLNIFGPTDSTERKTEHINLIIRDTHHQKGVESARHSGKDGVRRKERIPLEPIALPSSGILWRRQGPSLSASHFLTPGFLFTLCPLSFLPSLYWNCLAGSLALSAQFILHLCLESPKDLSLWNSFCSFCTLPPPFHGNTDPLYILASQMTKKNKGVIG